MYQRRTHRSGRVRKLQTIWLGPFRITHIDKPTGNCTLDIPQRHGHKGRVHNIFATDKLKKYHLREDHSPPIDYGNDDNEEAHEYEVEKIIGYKIINGKDYWQVKWKGYGEESNSWEPDENVRTIALEAMIDFLSDNNTTTESNTLSYTDLTIDNMADDIDNFDDEIDMGFYH